MQPECVQCGLQGGHHSSSCESNENIERNDTHDVRMVDWWWVVEKALHREGRRRRAGGCAGKRKNSVFAQHDILIETLAL